MSALRDCHKEYKDHLLRWELCGDLFEGEHCIHEAGEKYLTKLQDEDDKAYKARLEMTPVFGAFPRTVLGLRGMMFRKPMTIEVPPAITDMLNDIDLAGTTLQGLAQDIVEDALVYGRVGLLVDYPQAPEGATRADAVTFNLRPMIVKYDAKAIYNWRTERINGATVLSQVRLYEEELVQDPKDEFKTTIEKRYRVLDLVDGKYRQRLFKDVAVNGTVTSEVQIDEDVYPMMNGTHLDFIPFVVVGVDCIGIDVEAPPLIDLATTVLHHYQQATSYERGCFFSGLPTLFVSGVNNENADGTPFNISIGGNLANILPRPDSKAYFVEVAGNFEALRTNLEDKKREMAVLGARMLELQKAGVESADAIARRMSGEESLLSIMSQTISMGLMRAMQWFSAWAGANGEIKIELARDFMPVGMTSQDMVAQIGAWQQGAISQQTLFDNLKAGEIINSDVTYEQEQERIASSMIGISAPATTDQPIQGIDEATVAEMIQKAVSAATSELNQAIEALRANPQVMDMQPIADAIAAMPAPVVNVAQPSAPTITIAPPSINVAAPNITFPEQQAPIFNIAPPAVNVAGSTINMPDQPITVNIPEQQPANVTVNNLPPEGKKAIAIERDASGKIIGATAE